MIQIICRDQKISYTAYHLVKAFFPEAQLGLQINEEGSKARIRAEEEQGLCIEAEGPEELYQKLCRTAGRELPWGMLTGVRPVKLPAAWIAEHEGQFSSREEARADFIRYFQDTRFVSPQKAALAFDIAWKERTVLAGHGLQADGASLYVGIPFCPSVCRYCSFSSGPIGRYASQVDDYLQVLVRELRSRKEEYFTAGRYPDTIYMGGGTPTSLSEDQLRYLLDEMERIFSIHHGMAENRIKEYTVEAGRPDSITREKLKILKEHGVNRISVNPQTMNQKTLDSIGRAHTVEQTRQAYFLAREEGFDNINMDLIMGLADETADDVRHTLAEIEQLRPDSLTVHTLAIKRASALGIARRIDKTDDTECAEERTVRVETMIADASQKACSMGMEPYYLYRQKMMAGNFENIGYALPGKEGLYNILIMEEIQNIIACGAGATTKIMLENEKEFSGDRTKRKIVRQENVKSIEEYIRRGTC